MLEQRKSEHDHRTNLKSEHDHRTNLKAELEIFSLIPIPIKLFFFVGCVQCGVYPFDKLRASSEALNEGFKLRPTHRNGASRDNLRL
jgi:hypothetical protein